MSYATAKDKAKASDYRARQCEKAGQQLMARARRALPGSAVRTMCVTEARRAVKRARLYRQWARDERAAQRAHRELQAKYGHTYLRGGC